jgi:hypothetical protein
VLPLLEAINEMRRWTHQLQDGAVSSNLQILCQVYQLLWKRFERLLRDEVGHGAVSGMECLRSLVNLAQSRMQALADCRDTLFEFTEAALHGYALHRSLDKAMDAKFWHAGGDGGSMHDWKQACLLYLTGSSGDAARA